MKFIIPILLITTIILTNSCTSYQYRVNLRNENNFIPDKYGKEKFTLLIEGLHDRNERKRKKYNSIISRYYQGEFKIIDVNQKFSFQKLSNLEIEEDKDFIKQSSSTRKFSILRLNKGNYRTRIDRMDTTIYPYVLCYDLECYDKGGRYSDSESNSSNTYGYYSPQTPKHYRFFLKDRRTGKKYKNSIHNVCSNNHPLFHAEYFRALLKAYCMELDKYRYKE